jgi:hypothetical protein
VINNGSIGGDVYREYVVGDGNAVDNKMEIRREVEFGSDTEIYGGDVEMGVIGKKEIGRGYVEGVFRVGQRERVDMGIRERAGEREGYESKGMYVGGEIGGGYRLGMVEEIGIEIVGRVKVARVGREKVKIKKGEEVEYEGIESRKIKVRCVGRYKGKKSMIKPYIGVYYEGEVLRKVKGKVYGKELAESDMRGGRIEKERMRVEIGVKGYGGNKQGVEGMFRLSYAI